ncbi:MAG: RNA polymerase sigma-70 factor [Chitinophagaceae bacterium]|nr:RNA polymerase sigma-70 factor [Chitinophagaceae bacterium]
MPADLIYNERELLLHIAEGNEAAFATLFHHHKDRVFTIAKAFTENQVRSEEIVQDVFVRIWKNREKLNDIQNFEAWMYEIARNRSFSTLKLMAKEKKLRSIGYEYLPHYTEPVQKQINGDEINGLLKEGMKLLSKQQRQVFELSRLQGYSREEVAETLGIAKATVSVHLTIALRIMRSFLLSRLEISLGSVVLLELLKVLDHGL